MFDLIRYSRFAFEISTALDRGRARCMRARAWLVVSPATSPHNGTDIKRWNKDDFKELKNGVQFQFNRLWQGYYYNYYY